MERQSAGLRCREEPLESIHLTCHGEDGGGRCYVSSGTEGYSGAGAASV